MKLKKSPQKASYNLFRTNHLELYMLGFFPEVDATYAVAFRVYNWFVGGSLVDVSLLDVS